MLACSPPRPETPEMDTLPIMSMCENYLNPNHIARCQQPLTPHLSCWHGNISPNHDRSQQSTAMPVQCNRLQKHTAPMCHATIVSTFTYSMHVLHWKYTKKNHLLEWLPSSWSSITFRGSFKQRTKLKIDLTNVRLRPILRPADTT